MSLYGFIQDFQELIVGVGGFGVVVWTLRSNARLAREQHHHEADLARQQRQQDAVALVRGVLAELSHLRSQVQEIASAELKEGPDNDPTFFPKLRGIIYEGNAQNVGMIPQEAIPDVIRAYHKLEGLMDSVEVNSREDGNGRMTKVLLWNAKKLQVEFGEAVPVLDAAIESLRKAIENMPGSRSPA